MGSFERAGNRLMPNQKVKGVQSNENKYCVRYQNRSTGKWPVNYIQSQARGITLETEGVQESQVSILWDLWVMGPPCGLKVGRAMMSCTIM